MYAVVGCSDCSALWVVDGRPETTQCPRCGSRKQFVNLKQFVTTDDADHAREVRASMLANRSGHGDAFAEMDDFATMNRYVDEDVVSDDEYLTSAGIDTDEVEAAGKRAETSTTNSMSRKQRVQQALLDLDQPTEDEIVDYCTEHGVPADYTRKALEKLVRAGEASESRGQYRSV